MKDTVPSWTVFFLWHFQGVKKKAEEVPIIIQFGFVRWKLILSLYSHFLCSRDIPCPEKGDHNRILGFSHFEKIRKFINLTG